MADTLVEASELVLFISLIRGNGIIDSYDRESLPRGLKLGAQDTLFFT